jgi:hypothetical protein
MIQDVVNEIVGRVINSYSHNTSKSEINKIKELVSRTNPYRISEYDSDTDFIRDMIKTYLDKSWTTIFGNLMEQIQIEISGGVKTNEVGVDIEFPNKNIYVGSKSGPNWANSSQRKSLLIDSQFLKESKNAEVYVVCSYGKTTQKYTHYTQLAGQKGWEFLTNDEQMYSKIMEGFEVNNIHLKNLKKKVFGEIEKGVMGFWTEKFYINGVFQRQTYLDYVSKSN